MSRGSITVAVPVLNGAAELQRLLPVLASQSIDAEVEIIISDSESVDGSADVARDYGATVIEVKRSTFSHGGTRNLLMECSTVSLSPSLPRTLSRPVTVGSQP